MCDCVVVVLVVELKYITNNDLHTRSGISKRCTISKAGGGGKSGGGADDHVIRARDNRWET